MLNKHLILVNMDSMAHFFTNGLLYVLSHLEHFVETVRNYVKSFFNELVFLAAKRGNAGDDNINFRIIKYIFIFTIFY